jgi:rubrerythrin
MSKKQDDKLELFCTVLEMKEKKRALYEDAMKACPDQVGIETFRMLKDAEENHAARIREVYEELQKGQASLDSCKFYNFESEDKKTLLRRVAKEHGKMPKACLDDVVAIETGMNLENASIEFFNKRLQKTTDSTEKEFLSRMISEEREHFILLADLKFYYVDTENWFLEKGRQRLDGAGAVT